MLKHPSCIETPKTKDPVLYHSLIKGLGIEKPDMAILYRQRCILKFFREGIGLSWYRAKSMHDFSKDGCFECFLRILQYC